MGSDKRAVPAVGAAVLVVLIGFGKAYLCAHYLSDVRRGRCVAGRRYSGLGGVRPALVRSAGEARQAHAASKVSVFGALQKPVLNFKIVRGSEINSRWGERLVLFRQLRWCTKSVEVDRICCRHLLILRVSPAKQHIPRVEPRGFEPLTSAVQRRYGLSGCVLACTRVWLIYGDFGRSKAYTFRLCSAPYYWGCWTVAAQV